MKFSVLLPTRNRKELLAKAIETVRLQNYDNWEVIVSDNFSEEDIEAYVNSLSDHRIKYYRTPEFIPVTENWNNALKYCDGDYIIMLGDDDCILQDYFSTLKQLIEKNSYPDFVYTNALLYAYPGVLPEVPDGFLRNYGNRSLFKGKTEPYLLSKEKAIDLVDNSLNFRVTFDYNMQFSLVSKKIVEKLEKYGNFYQSPYPDYYASNALFLKSDRILIVPRPLVAIGISPKSFGYYYFNDQEVVGSSFLKNIPDPEVYNRIKHVVLPGSNMNTSWLLSMETLVKNFASEYKVNLSYDRYRRLQICSVYSLSLLGNKNSLNMLKELKSNISSYENIRYCLFLEKVLRKIPAIVRNRFVNYLTSLVDSHPKVDMPKIDGKFDTVLDVFSQIDSEKQLKIATSK